MVKTLVWAFKPISDLDGKTGLVECDADLAQKLIKENKVQDPRVGANFFKTIEKADEPKTETKKKLEPKAEEAKAEDDEPKNVSTPKGKRRTKVVDRSK